jgi:hypothetical protein
MKTMVKLAVLIATLLLLTGGAFAVTIPPPCNCYNVTYDDYGYENALLCFLPNNQGLYGGFCGEVGGLSLFFDDPVQALGFNTSQYPAVGYLHFHDSRLTVFKGIWNCNGDRYNLKGSITNLSNCVPYTCIDGILDGSETDVDCGGPTCLPCDDGKKCTQDSDCYSDYCDTGTKLCAPNF